ncbi:MAG: hypothetical protein HYT88_06210 [Candidatus Omnitrophica bacterium]|nr:hypothetical protein [Candidatus Omnitrophota bacterium]MBI3010599.1 hypothetical protein [Candidatus Omnitrophota bacterium]
MSLPARTSSEGIFLSIFVGVTAFAALTYWYPAGVPWILAILGGCLTWRLSSRFTDDEWCRMLLLWSYVLKVLLAALFYSASIYNWPILSAYNGGEGYWAFADDAQAYHNYGLRLAQYWRGVGPFPSINFGNWSFVLYVAMIYRWLGENPLNLAFLNAWYGTVMVLSAIVILKVLNASSKAIRLGVLIFAFWPSLIFWCSQPLKDPLLLAMMLVSLALLLFLLDTQLEISGWKSLTGYLGFLTIILYFFREYIGIVLAVIAFLMAVFGVFRIIQHRSFPYLSRILTVGISIPLSVVLASRIDLNKLLRPPQPPEVQSIEIPAPWVKWVARVAVPWFSPSQNKIEGSPVSKPYPEKIPPVVSSSVATSSLSNDPVSLMVQSAVSVSTAPTATAPQSVAVASIPNPAPSLPKPTAALVPAPSIESRQAPTPRSSPGRHPAKKKLPVRMLAGLRRGFTNAGGHSAIDPNVKFTSMVDVLGYVPRGLMLAFLAPLPGEWFKTQGRVGVLRPFAAIEMVILYILLIGWIPGISRAFRQRLVPAVLLFLFVLVMAIPMSLTVANLGTLFRLRLQFLLPFLILVSVSEPQSIYQRFWTWLQHRMGLTRRLSQTT